MSFVLQDPLIQLVNGIFGLYIFVIFAAVISSWLIAFGVLNTGNQLVRQVVRVLYALTEPLFRQVRRLLPSIGGIDLSPIVVLFGIYFLNGVIVRALVLIFNRV